MYPNNPRLPRVVSSAHDLTATPLRRGQEGLFVKLYDTAVRPFYHDETEDYARWVLDIHFAEFDRHGYFTRKKTIWVLCSGGKPVGFSVATEKRGGSIKFGPTALLPSLRGHGLATRFRLLLESNYEGARKFYNTLPEENCPALRYIIRAGYHIEAHLRSHYSTHGEIVVGKLLAARTTRQLETLTENHSEPVASPKLVDARLLAPSEFLRVVQALLSAWYDEIDAGFVAGLSAGMHADALAQKYKRVAVAFYGDEAVGLVVATPKRGGALKCSPLVTRRSHRVCFRMLMDFAANAFPERPIRKFYLHLPLAVPGLVEEGLSMGFLPEGILLEPYKPGVDMLALARVKQ